MKKNEMDRRPSPPMPRVAPLQRRLLDALTNWCLLLGGAAGIVIGGVCALRGESVIVGVAWGAAVLFLLGANVERFESLKGLGIEAKTRQIDDKLAEADDALERIRELSELTGRNLLLLHSKVGRVGAPSMADAYALAQQVKSSLTTLGSSEAAIKAALAPWVRVTCGDILSGLSRSLGKALQPRLEAFQQQRAARLCS